MKAEHRKELQTNSLADMLGRTVRNVRGGTGLSWTKVIIAGVIIFGLFATWWFFNNRARENQELWMRVEANTDSKLKDVAQEYKDTKQGKAARLTLAHAYLWEGIRMLGEPGKTNIGFSLIAHSNQRYLELEEECKEDPECLAEAKYGIAVGREALAAKNDKDFGDAAAQLDIAKRYYEDLAKGPSANTAYGILAKRRLEQLNNPAEYASILTFYREYMAKSMLGRPQ